MQGEHSRSPRYGAKHTGCQLRDGWNVGALRQILRLLTFNLSESPDSCCAAALPSPAPPLPRYFRTESCVSDKQSMACRGQARGCAGGGRTVVFHRHH